MKYSKPDEAAKSINELVQFLRDKDDVGFLYRGQTRDYRCLLPSGYRQVAKKTDSKCLYSTNFPKFEEIDNISKIKSKERGRIIARYGKILGSVISQQYGLSSICLDLTEDINVAGFFATNSYPHFESGPKNGVGIIYRLKPVEYASNKVAIDMLGDFIGKFINNKAHWFMEYAPHWALPNFEFDEQSMRTEVLFTHPMMVKHATLIKIWEEFYQQMDNSLPFHSEGFNLAQTRIGRQKAALIVPSTNWECWTPKDQEIEYNTRLKRHIVKPSWAIGSRQVGIEDSLAFPNMESFYFKHGAKFDVELSREYLWPSIDDDKLFRIISYMVELKNLAYLTEQGIDCEDQERGIIDRGYY